jgi:hypothetical protein
MWWNRNKKRILVLLHENEKKEGVGSAVGSLIPYWKKAGYKVIIQRGISCFTPADLLFVHIDLSLIPDDYQEFIKQYPVTVNGRVKDIRKRTISLNLISRNDDFDGQVIVKSNYNAKGIPEIKLLKSDAYKSPFDDYIIFDRTAEVPNIYWDHPNVVVEKFLPEREGDAYFMREYLFLGNEEVWIRLKSTKPIIKARTIVEYQNIDPDPDVQHFRKQLGFDYGKFDYVVHDGTPILLDANKTQGKGLLRYPKYNKTNCRRAKGIESFL